MFFKLFQFFDMLVPLNSELCVSSGCFSSENISIGLVRFLREWYGHNALAFHINAVFAV